MNQESPVSLLYHVESRLQAMQATLERIERSNNEHNTDHLREHRDHKEAHDNEHQLTQTALNKSEQNVLRMAGDVAAKLDEKTGSMELRISDLKDTVSQVRGVFMAVGGLFILINVGISVANFVFR